MGEGSGVCDEEGAKAKVFKDKLISELLYGGERKGGFNQEQGGIKGAYLEEGSEDAIPYLFLEVGGDEIATICRAAEAEALKVITCENLVCNEPPLLA